MNDDPIPKMDSSMAYEVLPGALDDGRPYEFKLAALLCLRSLDEEIEDMWLAMNCNHFGKLDDIIFYRKTKTCNGIVYLIQSKHQTNPTSLSRKEVTQKSISKNKKSNFYLKDYLASLEDIKNKISDNSFKKSEIINHLRQPIDKVFIILTNKKAPTECDFLKNSDFQPNLQTVSTGGETYLFNYSSLELNDDESKLGAQDFSEKLYLLAGQADVKQLDTIIENTIKNIVKPFQLQGRTLSNVAEKFVAIITNWSKGLLESQNGYFCENLDFQNFHDSKTSLYLWVWESKNQIRKILIDLILEPYHFAIKPDKVTTEFNTDVWADLVSDKDVTIITNSDSKVDDFLNAWICSIVKKYIKSKGWQKVWKDSSKVNKTCLRLVNPLPKISFAEAYEFLWKTGQIPLVLSFSTKSTFKVLEIIQRAFKVVVLTEMSEAAIPKLNNDIFSNPSGLSQQHRKQILDQSVTIQSRPSLQLQEIFDDTLFKMITMKDIINILRGNFNIGGNFARLPDFFIERSLSKILLEFKVLKELSTREVFVIECNTVSCFQEFLNDHDISIEESKIFICEKFEDVSKIQQQSIIITSDRNVGCDVLHQLTEKVVHYLVLHMDNNLEWISSNGNVKNIRSFRIHSETSYSKNEIANTFCNIVNPLLSLISADPGMGKTVLLDHIALSVPTSTWVIKVNLADHWEYYDKNEEFNSSQVIEYFFQNVSSSLAKQVFEKYLNSKEILFLLDGFDEILPDFQTQALKLIQCLQKSQYSICVAARPISSPFLEEGLQTFAVAIRPFNREDQENFLTEYFLSSVKNSSNNRNRIISFVDKLLSATEKNLNNSSFSSVPLQIFLIAEKFNDACAAFVKTELFINQQFDLLSLYEEFIEKKAKIAYDRFNIYSQSSKRKIENYRKLYALKVLFVKADLEQLNIDEQLNQCSVEELHLLQIDGVITVRNKSYITFVHRTFAEYLAALWLADINNFNCTKILIRKIFHPNYKVLRNIFDRIVARGSRIHTAILDLQFDTVVKIIKDDPNALDKLDKMGRTSLHLLAARGIHHDSEFDKNFLLNRINLVDKTVKKIPEELLNMPLKDTSMYSGVTSDITCRHLLHLLHPWDSVDWNYLLTFLDSVKEFFNESFINNDIKLISNYKFDSSHPDELAVYNIIICVKKLCMQHLVDDNLKNMADMVFNYVLYDLFLFSKEIFKLVTFYMTLPINMLDKYIFYVHNTTENQKYAVDNLYDKLELLLNDFFNAAGLTEIMETMSQYNCCVPADRKILLKELENDITANTIRRILKDTQNKGINKEVRDSFDFTPLDYAILSSSLSAADVICTQGMSYFTITDKIDVTMLVNWCSEFSYGSLATAVMKCHIDTDIRDALSKREMASNYNKYLLHTNIENNAKQYDLKLFLDDAQMIKEIDTGTGAIHIASSFGYTSFIEQLLLEKVNVNEKDQMGMTALHWAARNGHEETMMLLLDRGAEVDAVDHKNMTPLLHVISSTPADKTNLIKLLLKHRANINASDCNGNNALLTTVLCNDIQMTTVLIEHGADINGFNYLGLTALHWCARYGHVAIAKLLLENGADTEIGAVLPNEWIFNWLPVEPNNSSTELHRKVIMNYKRTPIQLAVKYGNFDIVNLLIDHCKSKGSGKFKQGLILIETAKYGQTDSVKLLLSRGVYADATDDEKKSALHWAAQFRHLETLTALLHYSSKPDAVDNRNMTALHWAAQAGFTEGVLKLLGKDIDINTRDIFDRTPLILAAKNNHIDILLQLLHNGADVNIQDNHGFTALHLVARKGQLLAVTGLVKQKADVNLKDNHDMTALQWAAYYGHVNVINFLVSSGADLESKDSKSGTTALIMASARDYPGAVKALLANGANVLAVNEERRSALHMAAMMGHRSIVKELLSKGADINAKDSYCMSPLLLAAKYGYNVIVDELLSNNANINGKDNQGVTALHLAACYNLIHTAKVLVDKGANTEETDARCMTPLHWATYKGNTSVVELLLLHNANVDCEDRNGRTPLIFATMKNYLKAAVLLLRKKANTNAKDLRNMTALHFAARKGCTLIGRLLLYKGSFLEAKDMHNRTPLILASSNGHADTVKLLLFYKASVNAHDHREMTALHWASLKGHRAIVELLLAKGADTKVRNSKGRDALILAAAKGHAVIVNLLLESSDIQIKDHGNATALQWAEHKGHKIVAAILRQKLAMSFIEQKC